jgi:hypothetical protein
LIADVDENSLYFYLLLLEADLVGGILIVDENVDLAFLIFEL